MIDMSEIMNIQLSKNKNLFTTKINIIFLILLPISIIIGSSIFNSLIIIIDLIFILELIKTRNNYILKDNNFYFLIIIFFYLICNSLFIATDKDYPVKDYESIQRSIGFLRFIILAYAIHFYFTKHRNKILKYWLLIFVVVTVDIIFEYIFKVNMLGFSSVNGHRVGSFRPDNLNIGGYYFGFIMLCLLYLKNSNQKFFIIASIFFFFTALLIGERSNFIKILFMYSFFILFSYKINFYKKIILIFLIFSITTGIILSNNALKSKYVRWIVNPIVQTYNNHGLNYNAFVKRIEYFGLYNTAMKIFEKNLTFGSGLKTFRYESYILRREDNSIYGASTHPHQIHFELLSEIGLIGYLLIIFNLLNRINVNKFNNNHLSRSSIFFVVATLLPILPSGSFFSSYSAVFFWINYAFLINAKPYSKP